MRRAVRTSAIPGWLNINRTQDFAVSLTKVMGRHTMKAGVYNNHCFKAQNTGVGPPLFQGDVSFANDTNNPLDTGYGFANAALGVFTRTTQAALRRRQHGLQQHRVLHPGQLEGEQPPDARLRPALHPPAAAVRPVPADVELLPRQWTRANAPCSTSPAANGCNGCCGTRNAMDPRTGQILTAPGAANTAAAIGTLSRAPATPPNGIRRAGDGIAKNNYTWPSLALAPRFGAAYDLTGNQTQVCAPAAACSTTVRTATPCSHPGNPPISTAAGSAQRPAADARPGPELPAGVPA